VPALYEVVGVDSMMCMLHNKEKRINNKREKKKKKL
jgi:hypothetical protein